MVANAEPTDADRGLHYWRRSRSFSHAVVCILPLIVLYHWGIVQSGYGQGGLLAEKWLFHPFRYVGLGVSQLLNIALLVAMLAALWRSDSTWRFSINVFVIMVAEGCLYALVLYKGGTVLTQLIMDRFVPLTIDLGKYAPYLLGLGAGVYEELLFRLILLGGGALALDKMFRWGKPASYTVALVLSSLIFAAVHHLGGEAFALDVFIFRSVCGGLLGLIFIARGLGEN